MSASTASFKVGTYTRMKAVLKLTNTADSRGFMNEADVDLSVLKTLNDKQTLVKVPFPYNDCCLSLYYNSTNDVVSIAVTTWNGGTGSSTCSVALVKYYLK